MADREKCIPPELASAEARAAAHQLRAIAARLLALAHLLPLPPEDELDRLLSSGQEQVFDGRSGTERERVAFDGRWESLTPDVEGLRPSGA
jgi:hypothetical protein